MENDIIAYRIDDIINANNQSCREHGVSGIDTVGKLLRRLKLDVLCQPKGKEHAVGESTKQ